MNKGRIPVGCRARMNGNKWVVNWTAAFAQHEALAAVPLSAGLSPVANGGNRGGKRTFGSIAGALE